MFFVDLVNVFCCCIVLTVVVGVDAAVYFLLLFQAPKLSLERYELSGISRYPMVL